MQWTFLESDTYSFLIDICQKYWHFDLTDFAMNVQAAANLGGVHLRLRLRFNNSQKIMDERGNEYMHLIKYLTI